MSNTAHVQMLPPAAASASSCDMDLGLGALFIEDPVTINQTGQVILQSPVAVSPPNADMTLQTSGIAETSDAYGEDMTGDFIFNTNLPFGVEAHTYTEDAIRSVSHERDAWKKEASRYKKDYDALQRAMCKNPAAEIALPAEMLRRLERLENEATGYRNENENLRENLKAANSEVAVLQNQIANQNNRLKGAGKKVRNAKDAAGKQEEKARDAVREKQDRVSSERKMKQRLDKALSENTSLTKLCGDLEADLEKERGGKPHMRKGDSASDLAIAVIPVEFTVERMHFLELLKTLEVSQASVAMWMQDWYKEWKTPKEPSKQVVGANYVDEDKSGEAAVNLDKLYADMVESGHQMTGAEHDGRRSKQSLETICRRAERQHNVSGSMEASA